MISPGRLWSLVKRDRKREWGGTYQFKALSRIADWSWPYWSDTSQTVPVHVLTSGKDWPLAAWMLASWFQFSERTWPIVIHDDGTLPDEAIPLLKKVFTNARIIPRREADAAVEPVLRSYPFCADYRKEHPLALKVFDAAHFASDDRFFLFDSDLLFFNYPHEILDWVASGSDECWFNEDSREGSLVTAAEARSELGIKIWSRVNSGLCLLQKSAIDLILCDEALAQTSILRSDVRRSAQTLLMLCAARRAKGGLLPRTYEVSPGKNAAENAISRHYTGAARGRFYGEGVKRLNGILFPVEHA